ncbi:glycosyltransferase family 2 protein [Pseudochryseolinea flava]|uniref:Glycosyltransferase family 2 protein n=2 Tax=Pseudochryseolinea flava TaxID=2059302 RepID=A0A364Y1G8_9BACT|nr:glycosyltransferase family 2 protein [Pseudochryseolinea flava]
MKYNFTASIVLYQNNISMLQQVIESVFKTKLTFRLYLVDNSPTDALRVLQTDERIEYIFNNANLGFGKAHNVAIRKSMEVSPYHLVLNPDIFFDAGVLEELFKYMEANPDVGQMMPKIMYPDESIQKLCKLLPTPMDLFLRRFFPWFPGAEARNRVYELADSGYDKIMDIPNFSGCFMFFRTSALKKVGLFDERIFMYIEDTDLTRRMHQQFRTVFYPHVHVYHHHEKGSYKNLKLMMYHLHGAFIYFSKWGWFFDKERSQINKKIITSYLR